MVAVDPSTRYVKVQRPEKIELARAQLPIYAEEQRIMEALHDSDVLILCGETGSGEIASHNSSQMTSSDCVPYLDAHLMRRDGLG